MEVHCHGLETFGVNKEADKVFNSDLKNMLAPPSSQIPAGEDFAVPPSSHPPADPVKDKVATISDDVVSNVIPTATFSFPPQTSDIHPAPHMNFQSFESGGVEQNSQNEVHQFGEQDEVFDDMVILENDVVTAASLSEEPVETLDALTSEVTDIQMDEFHPAPVSDVYNAPAVANEAVVEAVNKIIEQLSSVQALPATVTATDVTVVSTNVQEVPVAELIEATTVEVAPDLLSPVSDGLDAKVPEVTDAAETVNLTATDGGSGHVIADEEIQAIKGQKVSKNFGRKNYGGEVVDFDPETKWFKVIYEDGDEEDLEVWEVKQILVSSGNASSSKKRTLVDGDSGGSSRSPKKSKQTGTGSTAKKSRNGPNSAAKSPKTPGTKAKGSKRTKKSSGSKRAKSPGKLIKKALSSSSFKTPMNMQDSEAKRKEKTGTLTPKSTKDVSAKKTTGGKVSRSLNLKAPESQKKGKPSGGSLSAKKVTKSSGSKRKPEPRATNSGKSRSSKKAVIEAVQGEIGLVGKQVKKEFDGTLYDGVVVKFDKQTQFYKVKYADGDQEDLELHELKPILVQDLENTEDKDDKPAKLSSLSSLMSAKNVSGTEKRK